MFVCRWLKPAGLVTLSDFWFFSFGRTDGAPSAPGPLSRIFDVADGARALDRKLGSAVGNPTWLVHGTLNLVSNLWVSNLWGPSLLRL
jgi:hypothetical protein